MFRSWQTHRWRSNWDKSQLHGETDIWLKLGQDFIIKEKWIRLSCGDLGKNRGKTERREGEDDTVTLFTCSSDLRRKCSQRGGKRQTVPKEVGKRRRVVIRQRSWWGIAPINHYRPITLNQRISLFCVLVKRISVLTAPCGTAVQSNLINALKRGVLENISVDYSYLKRGCQQEFSEQRARERWGKV